VIPRLAGGRRAVAVLGALVAAAILVSGATAYAVNPVRRYVRVVMIRTEDTSSATRWLQDRLGPRDVLVMNLRAADAYSYPPRDPLPASARAAAGGPGFGPAPAPGRRVTGGAPSDHTAPAIPAAVAQARALLGPGGHVFVFQSHLHPADWGAYHKIGPVRYY